MITLFPNLYYMTKWKRRATMVLVFPIVIVEHNVNFFIAAYGMWNKERYFSGQ